MLERAKGADLIVEASGVGVHGALLEAAVPELKRACNTVVFWDVDAPATLQRMRGEAHDPFRSRVRHHDLIFTYGGGQAVIDAYAAFGARQCVPVYNALDPDTHFRVAPDMRFAADLGLLANRLPDREARVESFFLEPAARLKSRSFILGGNGWGDKPLPRNVRWMGHVYTRDHNAFNCTPLSVLNISRDSMAAMGFSPATRLVEAAGAAACLITDAWVGIDHFFEPGSEILVAADGDEVAAILDGLTSERARDIGEAAYRRVQADHTYAQRAALVERVLEGAGALERVR